MLFILRPCYPVEIHLTQGWDNPAVIKAMPVNNSQYLGKYVIARISSSDSRATSVPVVEQ